MPYPFLYYVQQKGILITTLWALSAFFIGIHNKPSCQCITFGVVVRILVRREEG